MKTNMQIKTKTKLYKKGQALIKAALGYWKEYQKVCDRDAVVWLQTDEDELIIITRSEYKREIMAVINGIDGKPLKAGLFVK